MLLLLVLHLKIYYKLLNELFLWLKRLAFAWKRIARSSDQSIDRLGNKFAARILLVLEQQHRYRHQNVAMSVTFITDFMFHHISEEACQQATLVITKLSDQCRLHAANDLLLAYCFSHSAPSPQKLSFGKHYDHCVSRYLSPKHENSVSIITHLTRGIIMMIEITIAIAFLMIMAEEADQCLRHYIYEMEVHYED